MSSFICSINIRIIAGFSGVNTLQAVQQRVAGQLIEQQNKAGLILRELKPAANAPDGLYLRYALVTLGPGDHIFPAFILDDWGREIRSLKLYRWVRDNGQRFPRGEIFGFEQDGRETQCFLRELELFARFPTYVYSSANQPVEEGCQLTSIFIVDNSTASPQRIKRPADVKGPLRAAFLSWWHIPPNFDNFEILLLGNRPDPGY